jgi:MFS superfamily sulfate permease-like transporter
VLTGPSMSASLPDTAPRPPTEGRAPRWQPDVLAGFLVFLIALPLCLGIAMASGFPPVAGILTAIVGGLVVSPIMGAPLTIKGPAAGLIVIVVGAVTELGEGDAALGYRRTLACIVVAGILQVGLGLVRAGRIADFFPSSVVHGMLAAIGVIIFAKQIHVMLGVTPHGHEPLELISEIPSSLRNLNPEIALIGALGIAILFALPWIKHPFVKKVPPPLVVLAVAVPLGLLFDLDHAHTYTFAHSEYEIAPRFLVTLPSSLLSAITLPDWSAIGTGTAIRYVVMLTLVGSIESLLSARAIDQLDTRKLKSDYDRDLFAVGIGNTLSGLIGGLPMIAEIVRSSANLSAGARSRWANFAHGAFLLVFVAFVPFLIHRIPLAALAAMLVFTGYRLASPGELVKTYKIGREQLTVFLVTTVGCIAVDLLVGVALGIVTKLLIELALGAGVKHLLEVAVDREEAGGTTYLTLRSAGIFTNYLSLKAIILEAGKKGSVVLDISKSPLVDHTTMERLHDLVGEFQHEGKTFRIDEGQRLAKLSEHPMAVRRSVLPPPA